jgi:hypothetical protein
VHADADVHATLLRKGLWAPAGAGVGWIAQLAPFHRSARVPALEFPTAVHADADVQDTLSSSPPPCGGLGVAWMVQLAPFHRSARVVALGVKGLEAPTAVHAHADVQDTPLNKPPPCGGFGVAWIDQRVPSHRSARVPAPEPPTAVHAHAEVQDTPFRPPPCGGLGVGWIDQLVPSHRSARVWEAPAVVTLEPTAVQADGAVHATPSRLLAAAPGGLGVGRMRHEAPSHCSARETSVSEVVT